MSNTGARKCSYCQNIIETISPIFWTENGCYHEVCYRYMKELLTPKSDPLKSERVSWNEYFIQLADLASTRSTCSRKHCGVVITKNNRILATGYNGSGDVEKDHCDDVGHFMVDGHCTRTVHAERNAIKFCIDNKIDLTNAKIFSNTFPCWNCFGEIAKSGIKEIYYKDEYRNDEMIENVAKFLDIKIEKV